jgi:hypothetical protein
MTLYLLLNVHVTAKLQVGRADGYILEGKELEFYQKLVSKKKGSKH